MTYLKDTEGDPLSILDMDGKKSWWAYISPDYDTKAKIYTGISIAVSIPEYLTDGESEYSSCGLLEVSLKEMFDYYLADARLADAGESLETFSKLLREYADKADAKAVELKVNEVSNEP